MTLLAASPALVVRRRLPPGLHAGLSWHRIIRSPLLLPAAGGLWALSLARTDVSAVNDFGLLAALPLTYFAGVAILITATAGLLTAPVLSPARLSLHLAALVVMVHAAAPILFEVPIYSWVYKHIGVIDYIGSNGALDPAIDIYHSWPGFFALVAWFSDVAGLGDPVAFAAWAPVYFNLLGCLVLGFAFRALGMPPRAVWLALFLFAGGNWVGQDYLAPQALAFVLAVGTTGMIVMWLRDDRRPRVVTMLDGLASRAVPPAPAGVAREPAPAVQPAPSAVVAALVLAVFAAIVVTHQLSPFVVLLGIGSLTVAGQVRPRWLVVAMGAMAVAYLYLHYDYVDRTQDLFSQLLHPLRNLNGNGVRDPHAMPGRQLTSLGAPLVVAELGALAFLGIPRRLRHRQPVLVVALLAASPALVAFGQSYGGEAVFRIYLFALPWLAALAAMAIVAPWRRPGRAEVATGAVLSLTVLGLLSAFFGSMELYEVKPGSVRASRYFYDHAPAGSLLTFVGPGFPIRASARYGEFALPPDDSKPNLLRTVDGFRHRHLGEDDLPAVRKFMAARLAGTPYEGYMVISAEQAVAAEVMGFLPRGSVGALERAMRGSPDWSVFYDDAGAVIFRFNPSTVAPEEATVE